MHTYLLQLFIASLSPHSNMSSATINISIGATSVPLLVVYPHNNPTNAELKAELRVIKDWFVAFNSDTTVRAFRHR